MYVQKRQQTGNHGAAVRIKNLTKSYDGKVLAVKNASFEIEPGEFLTLLGPSGCGKTTILRSIAGLEQINDGEIWIGDDLVSGPNTFVPPEKRDIGMIFQSYAIWPHMTVFENVAFSLRLQKLAKSEIDDRVSEALELVGLSGFEHRWGTQLSGGQQQRVALARSIVMRPRVLLFDEPLSNLDAALRERMRFELRRIQKELGTTAIYVTHDQTEAMAMSDTIIVMNVGVIVQKGTPVEIYEYPADEFVAGFIGLTNFLEGEVIEVGPPYTIRLRGEGHLLYADLPEGINKGEQIKLSIRPENFQLAKDLTEKNTWEVKVKDAVYLGNIVDVFVEFGGSQVRLQVRPDIFWSAFNEKERTMIISVPSNKVRCLHPTAPEMERRQVSGS